MYNRYIKRFFDIFFAFIALILLAPLILLLMIIIVIDSPGRPFYLQDRLGYKTKVFKIIKLRTMKSGADQKGSGLFTNASDPRITKFGKFLREYSLDELPQLINILKGDMSFIGPRPPVPYHPYNINEYPEKYRKRFLKKPGISGLAQVSGRTNLSWPERLEYDLQYINDISFILDLRITLKTIKKLIWKEDVFPDDINIGKSHLN